MEKEYLVGIDIGDGETTASCLSLNQHLDLENKKAKYNITRLSILPGHAAYEKKVMSAVCQNNEGKWCFVTSSGDYKKSFLMSSFKGRISTLSDDYEQQIGKKTALKAFVELVFNAIIKHNNILKYDNKTRKSNFYLCIACPSGWEDEEVGSSQQYKKFLRDIIPIEWIIKESDAALFKFSTNYNGKVFVFDIGSSTIDITPYGFAKEIKSFGYSHGARMVEEYIHDAHIANTIDHDTKYKALHRINIGNGDIHINLLQAERLTFRESKEKYYSKSCNEMFSGMLPCRACCPTYTNQGDLLVSYIYESEQIDVILRGYIDELRRDIKDIKIRIDNESPDVIIKTGGASRMPFIKTLLKETFPDTLVDQDTDCEYVVSDGIVLYAKTIHDCAQQAKKAFNDWATKPKSHNVRIYDQSNNVSGQLSTLEVLYYKALSDTILYVYNDRLKEELSNKIKNGMSYNILVTEITDFTINFIKNKDNVNKISSEIVEKLNESISPIIMSELIKIFKMEFEDKDYLISDIQAVDFDDVVNCFNVILSTKHINYMVKNRVSFWRLGYLTIAAPDMNCSRTLNELNDGINSYIKWDINTPWPIYRNDTMIKKITDSINSEIVNAIRRNGLFKVI